MCFSVCLQAYVAAIAADPAGGAAAPDALLDPPAAGFLLGTAWPAALRAAYIPSI